MFVYLLTSGKNVSSKDSSVLHTIHFMFSLFGETDTVQGLTIPSECIIHSQVEGVAVAVRAITFVFGGSKLLISQVG